MAKLNTAHSDLVAQLFNPKNGATRALRSDGTVLYRDWVSGQWKVRGKLKPNVTCAEYVEHRHQNGYRDYKRGDVPSYDSIRKMSLGDELAKATDGCEGLEPDGQCQHGCHAWPVALGLM